MEQTKMEKMALHTVEPGQVIVTEDRQRKSFRKESMDQLKLSISESGQIQPGVCFLNPEGNLVLVAGERRLRACSDLGVHFTYCLKEDLSPFELKKLELEENLCREDTLSYSPSARHNLHSPHPPASACPGTYSSASDRP